MLPAIGASLALDAIQSLTSPPQASSQPIGSGGFDLGDGSDVSLPGSSSSPVSGFSSAQISSDNFNTLLGAQSLDSGGLASALDPGSSSDSSQSQFGTASSAYNSVNQLVQSTAIPLGFSPVSINA